MAIQTISGYNATPWKGNSQGANFSRRREDNDYENPISRGTERNLAILKTFMGSALFGGIVGGIATCFVDLSAKGGYKIPVLAGLGALLGSLVFNLPSKLYDVKVGAYTREKEMDVFSRDRALRTNLTEEVHSEVLDPRVSLDKKLDDNLKLSMANRGRALGIADISAQR